MPRFALLDHDHPTRHWDLMLERDGVLWTWRLAEPLPVGANVPAERIGDHRLLYLDYEGLVSGNRGTVVRVDGGPLVWIETETGRIVVEVDGTAYRGRLEGTLQADGTWRWVYRPG
jgi:hypothetical protein